MRTDDNDLASPGAGDDARGDHGILCAAEGGLGRSGDPEALSRGHAEDATIVSPIFLTVPAVSADPRVISLALYDLSRTGDFRQTRWSSTAPVPCRSSRSRPPHVGEFMGIAGSGRTCEIQRSCIFEMGEGVIAHERRIYDFTGFLIQLGVLRTNPPGPEPIHGLNPQRCTRPDASPWRVDRLRQPLRD